MFIRVVFAALCVAGACQAKIDKKALKEQALEMFMHGYRSYMKYAYPADELMPLSCRGRVRGVTPSRGDVDDSLGNFSLTLIDTLDTLAVVGAFDEFEHAAKLIIDDVRFDADLVVSVFETNIRVLGGLLGGHVMAEHLRTQGRMQWYSDKQLLKMAVQIADRLLPAFNTTSGLPYSRINLRHGMQDYLKRQKDTCTACGGTMLLEMAALSRLTGDPIYEQKAKKGMDFLWAHRHRASDLMGTVLNVHSGDWVRRDSGIGAGIDSYYEYCLKAFILLGDSNYLDRFNKHYSAVMRYVNKGPLMVDVHMHRPTVATRSFMDALLAFWPGLQVLKGDLRSAIEMHEMLYQVVKKHQFLPEAFTHDFQVHWAEHPLRPEFIESTYFLYRATGDEHYLEVAKQVMDSLNENVRVKCGFAGVRDIRTMSHEDRMDSFVLSETFKYLYMIFAEKDELPFDPDRYVLTTEAHFLPLSIGEDMEEGDEKDAFRRMVITPADVEAAGRGRMRAANPAGHQPATAKPQDAGIIRERTQSILEELLNLQQQQHSHMQAGGGGAQCVKPSERLRAWAFSSGSEEHLRQLREMGIDIEIQQDGRMQLTHHAANALSPTMAQWGFEFMAEMVQLAKKLEKEHASEVVRNDRVVQVLSSPWWGGMVWTAAPAQFGPELVGEKQVVGEVMLAEPIDACSPLVNGGGVRGRVVVVLRGGCMFQEKARFAQQRGAIGVIVVDHEVGSSAAASPPFAMSGDANSEDDIDIPVAFLYHLEGRELVRLVEDGWETKRAVRVRMGHTPRNPDAVFEQFMRSGGDESGSRWNSESVCDVSDGALLEVSGVEGVAVFRFRFGPVTVDSEPLQHQAVVERHVSLLSPFLEFHPHNERAAFSNVMRAAGYSALGLNVQAEPAQESIAAIRALSRVRPHPSVYTLLRGDITTVRCAGEDDGRFHCHVV